MTTTDQATEEPRYVAELRAERDRLATQLGAVDAQRHETRELLDVSLARSGTLNQQLRRRDAQAAESAKRVEDLTDMCNGLRQALQAVRDREGAALEDVATAHRDLAAAQQEIERLRTNARRRATRSAASEKSPSKVGSE